MVRLLTLFVTALLLNACAQKDTHRHHPNYAKVDMEEVKTTFEALPKQVIDPQKYSHMIKLGKKLYFEKQLSVAGDISCNSCHQLDNFGVDNEATSPGHKGQRGDRNSPTVYNAAFHLAQFWDGRAADLAEQAGGPVLNPVEMAMPDKKEVLQRLKGIAGYTEMFNAAFPKYKKPMTYKNMTLAIAAFEKNLITHSRFDKFLKGDNQALSMREKEGLRIFMEKGCTDCHNGVAVGGATYQKLGAEVAYPNLHDKGRFNVTKDKDDMFVFKVPSLRNIEKTHPYFHDGSVKTLDDAIKLMAKHQLGKELSESEVYYVSEFLKSLTGELPDIDSI